MNDGAVIITIGQPGRAFLTANRLSPAHATERLGITFYSKDWPTRSGQVRLLHGRHTMVIERALAVVGAEEAARPGAGIYLFSVNSALGDPKLVEHDAARRTIYGLLERWLERGWSPLLRSSDPRLLGEPSFQRRLADALFWPDPSWRPSLEDWMALGASATWALHADRVVVTLTMRRDRTRMAANQTGAYMLHWKVKSMVAFAQELFAHEELATWKQRWPERLKELQRRRQTEEERLRVQGVEVAETYVDPLQTFAPSGSPD